MCSDIGSRQRCGAEMQNAEEKPCGDGQSAGSILTEQHLLQLVMVTGLQEEFKERVPKAREHGDNYQLPKCRPHEVKTFPDIWS